MYVLVLLALVSGSVTLFLTPAVRNLFYTRGWIDRPDYRKTHSSAVPRVGGISIAVAYATSMALLVIIRSPLSGVARDAIPTALKFFPAISVIFFTGLVDDLFNLKASRKLMGELGASALAIWSGVQIHGVGGVALPSWIAIPLTVLWLVGCSNAFNLIDGIDGLAVGAGLFATITALIAGVLQHNLALVLATVPLAGALFGFLRYNFNPASIFLGDCGSLFVGFLLGCFGIEWSQKSATVLGMTAPLLAFAIPLLDTLISMSRRLLRGRPIFEADREHIHHKLLKRGLSPKQVVLLLYAACGLSAALSLLLSADHNRLAGPVLIVFCACAWIGIQNLGYMEFQVARRLVATGTYRQLLNSHLTLQAIQRELAAASDIDEIWAAIQRSYRNFGFHEVDLQFDCKQFSDQTIDGGIRAWTARIPLSKSSWLTLTRRADSAAPPIMAIYIDTLTFSLRQKLPALSKTPQTLSEYSPVAMVASE